MAILVSTTTGNLSSSSTWNVVNAASYMDTRTGDSTIGAASQSSAFTPGAVTLSGICVFLASRAASPSGTLTASLINVTASTIVAGTSVTCNVSDFPSTSALGSNVIGWTFFKFAAPVTLAGATTYAVRLSTSVTNQMSAWRDSTAANWVRALVTTTNAAPTTGDSMIVVGQFLSAGTNTSNTVTMDNTVSATTYSGVSIGLNGIMSYGTNPSTNYYLRLTGSLLLGNRSTFNIGTSGTSIPATSTATLEFSASTLGLYFQNYGGTFNAYGAPLTYVSAKLSGDVSAGAIRTVTDVSTNWNVNDRILVATTSATTTQTEQFTITGVTGTTIAHSAYSFPHGGDAISLVQADIVNLTRNIKIFSTSQTNRTYNFSVGYVSDIPATYNLNYVEMYDMGSTTVSTGALQMSNFTNVTMSGCSMYITAGSTSINQIIYNATTTAGAGFLNVYDSIFYNSAAPIYYANNITGSTFLSNVYSFQNASGFFIPGVYGTFSGLTVVGSSTRGMQLGLANTTLTFGSTLTNCNFYGNAVGVGVTGNHSGSLVLNNCRFWRNSTPFTNVIGATPAYAISKSASITLNNAYFFGNTGALSFYTYGRIIFNNSYFWGGTGATTAYGINLATVVYGVSDTTYFNNCNFGIDYLGNANNFSTAIMGIIYSNGGSIVFTNTNFSGTETALQGGATNLGILPTYTPYHYISLNHNNVIGTNKMFTNVGTLITDTTITNFSSPSLRLTPTNATLKIRTSLFRVPVQSGQTCNISVWVRKSTAGDGTAYNGNQPRLMYLYNPFAGNTTETVGDIIPNSLNLLTFPEDLSNASWSKTGLNTTGTPPYLNVDVAPINPFSTTVDGLVEDTSTGLHTAFRVLGGLTSGVTYTMSCYVKKGSRDYFSMLTNSTLNFPLASAPVRFNLNTGVVEFVPPASSVTASITPVGNGWYRCSTTFLCGEGGGIGTTGNIYFATNNGTTASYLGNNTLSTYIWGMQFETGSTATQYIAEGIWQQLTYTTPVVTANTVCEFYVDCDGTTGWINVDDWNSNTFNNTKSGGYWGGGGIYVEPDYRTPGGNYTFIT